MGSYAHATIWFGYRWDAEEHEPDDIIPGIGYDKEWEEVVALREGVRYPYTEDGDFAPDYTKEMGDAWWAARSAIGDRHPDVELAMIGHSVGGYYGSIILGLEWQHPADCGEALELDLTAMRSAEPDLHERLAAFVAAVEPVLDGAEGPRWWYAADFG